VASANAQRRQERRGGRREATPLEMNKISDRLYEIVGGRGARGGAYVGDNGVLVVDAKMDRATVEQVRQKLKVITDKPITHLVNTHSDGDHVRGNQFFPNTVTIIAHENCRKEFFISRRQDTPSEWTKPELADFVPSLTFREKMDVHLGKKKVELWYFGVGHTTGDIVVYFPEEKTAFVGDQLFQDRVQLIHSYKGGNSFDHVKTLKMMLEILDAEQFCSGHSEMTDRASIKKHIAEMERRQATIKGLVSQGATLDKVKAEFSEDELRLVEVIFRELSEG
jgi:glyoxylase-like metal-dependent hydrolase (beta-lactamase superfamily II)